MQDKELIRTMYESGMTCRAIADAVGSNSGNIYRIVADIARSHLNPESKNWRTCRRRARKLMEKRLGRKLEPWEHVHHINNDFTDNSPENLKVVEATEHAHIHKGFRDVNAKRDYYLENKSHLDEYHQQWRTDNPDKVAEIRKREGIARRQFEHICAGCGVNFKGLKRSKYCSRSCSSSHNRK